MPLDKITDVRPPVQPAPLSGGGLKPLGQRRAKTAAPSEDEGTFSPGAAVAGAGALAGTALLATKFRALAPFLEKANALRQQLMLSGFAVPKSILGNTGAVVEEAIESGSLRPLKEFLSRQTLQDAKAAYTRNAGPVGATAHTRGTTLPGPMPGRIMGAMDEATQGALRRSGVTAEGAENAVLQSPLTGGIAEALDSPAARYIHPFRRTPFNQFIEGLKRLPGGKAGSARAKAIYSGAGAIHGAATAEDDMPVSLPLAMAGAARYGYPYGAAALLGRALVGGKGAGGATGGMLPVSEYGLDQSISDPLAPFRKPAALTALDKLVK